MQGEDQRRVVGDAQNLGRYVDALGTQLLDFGDEMMRIDDDAVADDAELAAHEARRQQRQLVADTIDDQRMARIVSALIAHDHIGTFRKPVDNLALAFVTPLRTDHNYVRHSRLPVKGGFNRSLLKPAHL